MHIDLCLLSVQRVNTAVVDLFSLIVTLSRNHSDYVRHFASTVAECCSRLNVLVSSSSGGGGVVV